MLERYDPDIVLTGDYCNCRTSQVFSVGTFEWRRGSGELKKLDRFHNKVIHVCIEDVAILTMPRFVLGNHF